MKYLIVPAYLLLKGIQMLMRLFGGKNYGR
jgi:hypothetical protein